VKLKIPAGIDEGSRLRSSGGGEAGLRGAANGDLYVVIHIKEHEIFVRDGLDLHCEMPVPFVMASLGGEMRVPVLGGSTVSVKIPAGTQGGTTFRVRGQGIQPLRGSTRGDMLVRVHVEVPTRLNGEQRKALEKFAELCGEENTPLHKTFTDRIKEFFT
jgi:molecular chaperone DnaJ